MKLKNKLIHKSGGSSQPLVSIIVSTFNDADRLRETLSVFSSTGMFSSELLVIDGGSNDGTELVVSEFESLIDFYVSEPDDGIYDAWNKGLGNSSGAYIAFLGAGDYYLGNGLQRLIDFAFVNKDADLILSNVGLVKGKSFIRQLGSEWDWKVFRRYMNIAHVGALHSRRLFDKYGSFDASYRIAGDYEFLLRAGDSLKTAYLDDVVIQMEADGVSQTNPLVFFESERAKIKNNAVTPALARFDTYVAIFKKYVRRMHFIYGIFTRK